MLLSRGLLVGASGVSVSFGHCKCNIPLVPLQQFRTHIGMPVMFSLCTWDGPIMRCHTTWVVRISSNPLEGQIPLRWTWPDPPCHSLEVLLVLRQRWWEAWCYDEQAWTEVPCCSSLLISFLFNKPVSSTKCPSPNSDRIIFYGYICCVYRFPELYSLYPAFIPLWISWSGSRMIHWRDTKIDISISGQHKRWLKSESCLRNHCSSGDE